MNDRYLPGTGLFWVYWVIALPLIILVFLVVAVINLGFDDEGGWSLERYIRIVSRMSGHNSEKWRGLYPWSREMTSRMHCRRSEHTPRASGRIQMANLPSTSSESKILEKKPNYR